VETFLLVLAILAVPVFMIALVSLFALELRVENEPRAVGGVCGGGLLRKLAIVTEIGVGLAVMIFSDGSLIWLLVGASFWAAALAMLVRRSPR
jgi:hypothetical protein